MNLAPSLQPRLEFEPASVTYRVMAGGQGSRLWPLSHSGRLKQFADLLGQGTTLLQMMVARLRSGTPASRIFVSTAPGMVATVRDQLPWLAAENIIAIPENRDTLPALGYAAICIGRRYPDATLIVLASDNRADDIPALHAAFDTMTVAAQSGAHLVSLGIRPTYASTAYGYMLRGAPTPYGSDTCFGDGYHEKLRRSGRTAVRRRPPRLEQRHVCVGHHDVLGGLRSARARACAHV